MEKEKKEPKKKKYKKIKQKKDKIQKNIKKHKKAPLRSGAVLKKRLAREINKIEILRNIQ